MKILIVSPVYYPAWQYGGLASIVYNLSNELSKLDNRVTIYTTDALDKDLRQKVREVKGNPEVHLFKNINNTLAWKRIFTPIGMPLSLRQTIMDFDIVHMFDYRNSCNIISYYYSNKFRIPFVISPLGAINEYYSKKRLKEIYDEFYGHKLLEQASRIIEQSNGIKADYIKIGINLGKITALPNGIDIPNFDALPSFGTFRERFHLGNKQKVLLYLGRLDAVKGLGILLEAYKDVLEMFSNTKLVIVGPDTGYLQELRRQATILGVDKDLMILGPLTGDDKFAAYVDADMYILPSWLEEFGLAPLEAFASGTRVIVTERCGVAEWMKNEFDFIIPYDAKKLKDAIITTLSLEKLDENQRKFRYHYIKTNFSWQTTASKLQEIYKNVIYEKNCI